MAKFGEIHNRIGSTAANEYNECENLRIYGVRYTRPARSQPSTSKGAFEITGTDKVERQNPFPSRAITDP
ncbi:hypothetical protein AB0C70_18310 [Streptomyces sp. NPDC048564]|uniref:hypothetical protein n=1 Tax=Streptomyces sp. NPDC048564 TaxID=3155760 RepID=UPI0034394AAF